MDSEREFDIIVYGATGYSGTITAEYLVAKAPENVKWAIAGRDSNKLESLATSFNKKDRIIPTIQVKSLDYEKLLDLAKRTRILISFIGPYRKYGEPIVAACVDVGTDYIDATGEPQFIHDIITKYHDVAGAKGLYILPACAIGSLIPDIAVEILKEDFVKGGTKIASASTYIKYNGRYCKTFSNGTWNTLINSMASVKKPAVTHSSSAGKTRSIKKGFHIYTPLNNWAVPFIEGGDVHIIRRSNELNLNTTGNENFAYGQYILFPLIPPLYYIGTILTILIIIFFSRITFIRKLLERRVNPVGGPTKQQRADCSVDLWVSGKDSSDHSKSLHMRCPGPYDTTGITCAEVALILATERSSLKKTYGVVTPASVMSSQLQVHLRERGCITWE